MFIILILLQGRHQHILISALDGLMSKMLPWPIFLHMRFPQQMEGIAWWKELFTTRSLLTSSVRCILPFLFRTSKFILFQALSNVTPAIHKCNAFYIFDLFGTSYHSYVFYFVKYLGGIKCFPMISERRVRIIVTLSTVSGVNGSSTSIYE